ncbi:MAG: hypothetical protein ORN57_05670, partial [Alphaproteobacteria bacterium]|nr:hypothetical protein [Alphaproteobacteria bacterium]
ENSSNSKRLLEVGLGAGIKKGKLINAASDIDFADLSDSHKIALTAGASAPEELVQGVITALEESFDATLTHWSIAKETLNFKLPKELANLSPKHMAGKTQKDQAQPRDEKISVQIGFLR